MHFDTLNAEDTKLYLIARSFNLNKTDEKDNDTVDTLKLHFKTINCGASIFSFISSFILLCLHAGEITNTLKERNDKGTLSKINLVSIAQ